jgi:hypothetical protein
MVQPDDPTYWDPKKVKSRKTRKKVLNIVDWTLRIGAIAIILIIVVVPFLSPYLHDEQAALFEYMMTGLEQYQEMPDYAIHDVERFISITGPGYPIKYTIKITKPKDMYLDEMTEEEKEPLTRYPIQEVEYDVIPDSNIKVVKNEREVANQGGKSCVIIVDDDDKILLKGYNLSDQKHNFKISYRITVKSIDWGLNPSNTASIKDIPDSIRNDYDVRQWEVGDLNGDGELDQTDEDQNGNAKLDFGEDLDNDGYLDVNEDLDGDGLPDWRFDPDSDPITAKAKELKGSKTNVFEILEAFYGYLREKYHYPNQNEMAYDYYMYAGRPKSAMRTMEDKYGDCDDQSILLISMCRAVGIPAWLECGALFDPTLKAWEPHGWANIWVPMTDGTVSKATIDVVNRIFLVRDANRFTEWIDSLHESNDPEEIEEYYTSFSYSYSTQQRGGTAPEYTDEYEYVSFEAHPSDLKIKV